MKIAGIVAEYNPFHNGHKYQIQATRQAGAEGIFRPAFSTNLHAEIVHFDLLLCRLVAVCVNKAHKTVIGYSLKIVRLISPCTEIVCCNACFV